MFTKDVYYLFLFQQRSKTFDNYLWILHEVLISLWMPENMLRKVQFGQKHALEENYGNTSEKAKVSSVINLIL